MRKSEFFFINQSSFPFIQTNNTVNNMLDYDSVVEKGERQISCRIRRVYTSYAINYIELNVVVNLHNTENEDH